MKIDTIIESGKFIQTCSNPEGLAYFPENKQLVAYLFTFYRMEWTLGRDGQPLSLELKDWTVKCKKGRLFEFGPLKLGISVEGIIWKPKFIHLTQHFCTVKQNGDGEANLWCEWNKINFDKLVRLLKPVKRRTQAVWAMGKDIE